MEEDIEELIGHLNEHATAETNTWYAKFFKTIQKLREDFFEIVLENITRQWSYSRMSKR